MSLVLHIFKKDLLRLRIFLYFWLPVVLVAGIASCLQAPGDDFAMQTALKVATALAGVCQFIMMALMIPLLMHSEPLTGTTAFWLTRPLKKSDVMKSKLLFAGLFFILVPTIINAVLLVANQVPFSYILPASMEYVLSYTGALLLLMAIAALTRNFGFFALVGGVYLIAAAILGVVVVITTQFQALEQVGPGMVIRDSRELLSTLAGILLLSTIIYFQYRSRKTRWVYSLLILEFLITFWIGTFSKWAVFKEPGGTLTAEESKHIQIALGRQNSHVSDSFSMRRRKESYKEVSGKFRFDGLPENSFAKTKKVDATFEVGDQKTGGAALAGSSYSEFIDLDSLRSLLEPLELVRSRNHFSRSDQLLKISESDYLAIRGETGKYAADITFNVFRYGQVAALPLKAGEKYTDGALRISIASVLNETEGCSVILRHQSINPLFRRDRDPVAGGKLTFVLANLERSEAYLPQRDNNYVIHVGSGGAMLSVQNKFLCFTSTDKPGGVINEAWLKDAELLIVETKWLGEVQKHVEDNNFSISQSASSYIDSIPNTSAKDNQEKLDEITLPDNPSRNEVKAYIQKIHNISATQSSYSDRDPQVDMLLQIGPENLDLLIHSATDSWAYYEKTSIRKMVQPEHKELVLKYLLQLPMLSEAVDKYGWQEDAQETLLNGLKRHENLPSSWLKAVASLQDPETYPLLIDFLIRGGNRDDTYNAIKDLPGIELDEAVPKAWKKAKYDGEWERRNTIPLALEFGQTDALGVAIMELADNNVSGYWKRRIRKSFALHTGMSGTYEELGAWYIANKDRLRFDPETKLFVAEGGASIPKPADRKEALLREARMLLEENHLDIEIAVAELADNGELVLHLKGGDQLAEGPTATFQAPALEQFEDAVRKMRTVIKINAARGDKVKSMTLTGDNKVAVTYE